MSPLSVSPVRKGPDPGSSLESTAWTPASSDASIDSKLQLCPSVQGSPSSNADVQVDGPFAGSVEVSARPFASVATHRDSEPHETEVSSSPSSMVAWLHVPDAGSVET